MKTFGAGEFKLFVEMKETENEMHLFMSKESRQRFIDSNKRNKSIKRMSKDPK